AQLPRRWKQRWKRRRVEKSPNRLSPPAWKSRQRRGIPTFPPLRRLRVYEQKPKPKNRTFHLLQKADIFTCYEQGDDVGETRCAPCIILSSAPVAQLDRAIASGAIGREFESLRARQNFPAGHLSQRSFAPLKISPA